MPYYGPKYGKKQGVRDSQRKRVYGAEGVIPAGQNFTDVASMQAYTDHLLDSAWARRRWGRRSITVKPGFGHRNARGGYGDVQMPRWSRKEKYLLHELAHNLAGGDAWHDPTFVRVMLELVEHVFGKEAEQKFREAIREHRVKVGPPLVLKPVEATPAAPLRLTERPFRIEIKRRGKEPEVVTVQAKTITHALDRFRIKARSFEGVIGIRVWQGREVKKTQPRAAAKTKKAHV